MLNIFYFGLEGFTLPKINCMKSNEQLPTPKSKKVKDEIDVKIDRLQKQYEAETAALKKLLDGLDKIEKARNINSGKK